MNFQITQGSGTTIGSDQVAGVNFQEIKLIDATLGSAAPIGNATNPLKVSLEFTGSNSIANPIFVDGNVTPNPFDDRVTIGTMAAAIDQVIVDCTGISTLGWTTSGNWIGTMTHEVDYGDGQWFIVETLDTNLADDGKPFVVTQWTEALNNDPWITNVAGAKQLRFRFISYTSGSALITTNGSVGTNAVRVYNLTPSILQATALIKDSANNDLTSTGNALDVNLKTSSIVLPVSQSGTWNINNISGTISLPTGASTSALQTTGNNSLASIDGKTPSLGQATMAASTPVVIASNQSAVPVTLTSTTITGTVAVTQSGVWSVGRTWTLASGTDSIAAVQSGTWNINNISGTISLPTGAATEATLATRLADATFTARVNTLGQKTMTNSTPVVLASDQTVIPVSQSGAPWSQNITQIAGSAISTAATGIARVGVTDGTGNAITSTVVSTTRSIDVNQTQNADGYASQQNQVFTTSVNFNLPTAATESPAIFLKNPSGSGKTLIVKKILAYGISTNNNGAAIIVYSNPTTSADGTAQVETTTSIGSSATAVATAFTGPTVTGGAFGARLFNFTIMSAANNNSVATPPEIGDLIRVTPNNTLLITGNPTANNFNVGFTIIWQEV